MKLMKTLSTALIAAVALTGTAAQAAADRNQGKQDGPEKTTVDMKYYQHKDAAAPGKAGASAAPGKAGASAAPGKAGAQAAPQADAKGIAPRGSAGIAPRSGGMAPNHQNRHVWPPHQGHYGYTELLYQQEATVYGVRDSWVQHFDRRSVVIERRGNVFEGYIVQRFGWQQHAAPLFRITTDMILNGYVYYGQAYTYRTGPFTLTVELGDLLLQGNRVQGMSFWVTLEREYSRFSNYYSTPGYPQPYLHGGYARTAPGYGVNSSEAPAPGRAVGRTEVKNEAGAPAPGKAAAGAADAKSNARPAAPDDETAF